MTKISNTIKVKTGENSFEDEIKVSYIEPNYSAAEGKGTIASSSCQHVEGKYNIEDTENKYIHIAGNGNDDTGEIVQSNAHTLDWNGNAWFAGDVTYGVNNNKLTQIDLLINLTEYYETMPDASNQIQDGFDIEIDTTEKYNGFIITSSYGYNTFSQIANSVFIPLTVKGLDGDVLEPGEWNDKGYGQIAFMWQYGVTRSIQIDRYMDGVTLEFGPGYRYDTYGASSSTKGLFAVPRQVYGVKNINNSIDLKYK